MDDRPGYSLYSLRRILFGAIGFVALIALTGSLSELLEHKIAKQQGETAERLIRGTLHLERLNGLIYKVVMESRGIYMSPDWQTAEQFGKNIPPALAEMQQIAAQWKEAAAAGQQANVEELGRRIDQFVRFRTELVRLGREESTAAARVWGDNDANRNVRMGLNQSLDSLGHAYERDLKTALREAERTEDNYAWMLAGIAASGAILLLGILVLIRQLLLAPLFRLRERVRRLAAGDLDSPAVGRERAMEIAEMGQAVEVFRRDLLDRRRLARETHLLARLNEWLQSCNSLSELYEMADVFLAKMLPGTSRNLFIYNNSHDFLRSARPTHGAAATEMRAEDCWALRRGRIYTFGENEVGFPCAHVPADDPSPYCCIPILAHGETIGLLHLRFSNGDASAGRIAEERRLAILCTEQIGLTIANVQLRDRLREQSIRDPLTGLFNRRFLLETGRREFARAVRSGQSVGVLSFDVDHFKMYNDEHGHDAGDTVLRAIGDCLRSTFRTDDVPCRAGGEEFVVILPGTSIDLASQRAEQLRAAVAALVVRHLDHTLPPVTISIGVAAFPASGETLEDVLRVADETMYRAKANGRNRVEMFAAGGPSDPQSSEAATVAESEQATALISQAAE